MRVSSLRNKDRINEGHYGGCGLRELEKITALTANQPTKEEEERVTGPILCKL